MPDSAQKNTFDIVENRARLNVTTKLRLLYVSSQENGLWWAGALIAYYLASGLSTRVYSYLQRAKAEKGLPGTSSPRMNELIWSAWDWSAAGEEWT
ncbi:MAG TPA: hypothetical protein VND95_15205, partial [Stellaceae bacterium]|nr:hypothetical protein [Stellaceae bacterium]